jgi:hypothetical protein
LAQDYVLRARTASSAQDDRAAFFYRVIMRVGLEIAVERPAPFEAETRTRKRCPASFAVSV